MITLVFEKNAKKRRKFSKIAENCDHNIDPSYLGYFCGNFQKTMYPKKTVAQYESENSPNLVTLLMPANERRKKIWIIFWNKNSLLRGWESGRGRGSPRFLPNINKQTKNEKTLINGLLVSIISALEIEFIHVFAKTTYLLRGIRTYSLHIAMFVHVGSS
jgi:hypothetical protein